MVENKGKCQRFQYEIQGFIWLFQTRIMPTGTCGAFDVVKVVKVKVVKVIFGIR